ncbi:LacI family DNA-binding transcriptional regulator [Agriterribacter sp.]|uniref:LacI family DNA-binding transcriptional regulator n=1 Tax=Agriterribacter sp. TaxID=2821509 RepID=UPI002BF748EF|nr:LacI family DNA-binding transcriptional regulator [Agriterribacter sp.]HRP56601.1 LacI family DNA-binding transcriptional regulator [Agriterribacter sp.]
MNKPVTIKDIARKFRCSPSTVSRALNNHPSINEDTRRNLQEYAQKVGYQRNQVSLNLLNTKTASIGVIVPTINNYYESAIIEGIDGVLHPLGYTLNICVTNEQYLLESEYVTKLLSNRVEGIFLSVSQETYDSGHYEHLENVGKRNLPLIFIDRDYEGFSAGSVTIDDYHGAFAAVEHLVNTGRRRIAHLKGPNGMAVTEQRFRGYTECLAKYGLPVEEELIINTNFKVESALDPTAQLLELEQRPDAIFGVNDQVAIGAMKVIREKGRRVPEDIAVVGFDNSPISPYISPSLTSVARPGRQIGEEAARIFLNYTNTAKKDVPVHLVLPSELIIRDSSGGR